MQIALTGKLAKAMDIKPASADPDANPLFSWTANWTNTFDDAEEDLIVMVNDATRFTVALFGVKSGGFRDIAEKMVAAVRNTLLAMQINPEVVDAYLRLAGEAVFVANRDRKRAALVSRQGLEAALVVGDMAYESEGESGYMDTFGRFVSEKPVYSGNNRERLFVPVGEMVTALAELTGKPAYKYRAFELLVTLDLEIYKATRRLIVPADIAFPRLHTVLQEAFRWDGAHLYDFRIFERGRKRKPAIRLVAGEEDLLYDSGAILMAEHTLSEYMPAYKHIRYTYDMGDNWEHDIKFVRVIEDCAEESPRLLEASGQSPPEDIGGVGGFINFREAFLDPNHPEHAEAKAWIGYWSPELKEWDSRPRVISC
ncbi:MAG: plasmid pRiA4b ORF-3 family protein [Clostridiales Family XIII bacterium]|nr:plasmid pRiA4b ORF-3 family protein [Clostridiales Family XIII bacterium]